MALSQIVYLTDCEHKSLFVEYADFRALEIGQRLEGDIVMAFMAEALAETIKAEIVALN